MEGYLYLYLYLIAGFSIVLAGTLYGVFKEP